MPWDHDGSPIEGANGEEIYDRAAELGRSLSSLESGLDRANLVFLIDGYRLGHWIELAGDRKLLLHRMAMAGPELCTLSAARLGRDCGISPRWVYTYRAEFVAAGLMTREIVVERGRQRFEFRMNWLRLFNMAVECALRRPVEERIAIIDRILRTIADRNGVAFDPKALAHWLDPSTPSKPAPGERPYKHVSGAAHRRRAKERREGGTDSHVRGVEGGTDVETVPPDVTSGGH
jgi:hypothetical protein